MTVSRAKPTPPADTPPASNPPATKPPASKPPVSKPPSGDAPSGSEQTYLDIHNTERSKHGAGPLVWNNTLADAAQTWANKCTATHSGGSLGPFGENLSWGTGGYSIADALQALIDEASDYDPNHPEFSHWTQMVWKSSTNLGCAVSTCNNLFDFQKFGATLYYVCEYWPAGNVEGQFGLVDF
ncbi:CAP domain-containing protein [Mycena rebaudengoi]|nr:CAP domain-containing protein [Mycena rebaudengoi]